MTSSRGAKTTPKKVEWDLLRHAQRRWKTQWNAKRNLNLLPITKRINPRIWGTHRDSCHRNLCATHTCHATSMSILRMEWVSSRLGRRLWRPPRFIRHIWLLLSPHMRYLLHVYYLVRRKACITNSTFASRWLERAAFIQNLFRWHFFLLSTSKASFFFFCARKRFRFYLGSYLPIPNRWYLCRFCMCEIARGVDACLYVSR